MLKWSLPGSSCLDGPLFTTRSYLSQLQYVLHSSGSYSHSPECWVYPRYHSLCPACIFFHLYLLEVAWIDSIFFYFSLVAMSVRFPSRVCVGTWVYLQLKLIAFITCNVIKHFVDRIKSSHPPFMSFLSFFLFGWLFWGVFWGEGGGVPSHALRSVPGNNSRIKLVWPVLMCPYAPTPWWNILL